MNNEKTRILIVDDEPDVLTFLSYNLRKKNYEVVSAENGAVAIDKLASFKPDIILSDVMMPDMDGIDMCETLKSQDEFKNIPIIFLSAIQDDFQVMRAGITGDGFISKPISFDLLYGILEGHRKLERVVA